MFPTVNDIGNQQVSHSVQDASELIRNHSISEKNWI